jgi:hypothetical protein
VICDRAAGRTRDNGNGFGQSRLDAERSTRGRGGFDDGVGGSGRGRGVSGDRVGVSTHGKEFQAVGARAAAFQAQFERALTASAGSYAGAEAANAAAFPPNPLQAVEQQLLNAINGPFLAHTGRPLIGNGANGAPGDRARRRARRVVARRRRGRRVGRARPKRR